MMNGKSGVTVVPVCPQKSTTDWSKTGGHSNAALLLVVQQNTPDSKGLSAQKQGPVYDMSVKLLATDFFFFKF